MPGWDEQSRTSQSFTKKRKEKMKMRKSMIFATAVFFIACFAFTSIADANLVPGTIKMSGSTTVLPVSNEAQNDYTSWIKANYGITETLTIGDGGSGQGWSDLIAGLTDMGASSRLPKNTEFAAIPTVKMYAIGIDSVAIIVHNSTGNMPGNYVTQLTGQQVSDIFCGLITDWHQLNSSIPVGTAVHVAVRISTSGTADCFNNFFLVPFGRTTANITGSANVLTENIDIYNLLSSPAGQWYIAYIGLGFVHLGNIQPLNIDLHGTGTYVTPTKAHVLDGSYAPFRWLWYMTNGTPTDQATEQWIAFVKSNTTEQVLGTERSPHDYIDDQGYIDMWRADFTGSTPASFDPSNQTYLPDNKVDYKDVLYFIKGYISYTKTGIVDPYLDFNADHVIDYKDQAAFALDYIAFWNSPYAP
jgi:ABC-type phosphate transport system substrate-binding protein